MADPATAANAALGHTVDWTTGNPGALSAPQAALLTAEDLQDPALTAAIAESFDPNVANTILTTPAPGWAAALGPPAIINRAALTGLVNPWSAASSGMTVAAASALKAAEYNNGTLTSAVALLLLPDVAAAIVARVAVVGVALAAPGVAEIQGRAALNGLVNQWPAAGGALPTVAQAAFLNLVDLQQASFNVGLIMTFPPDLAAAIVASPGGRALAALAPPATLEAQALAGRAGLALVLNVGANVRNLTAAQVPFLTQADMTVIDGFATANAADVTAIGPHLGALTADALQGLTVAIAQAMSPANATAILAAVPLALPLPAPVTAQLTATSVPPFVSKWPAIIAAAGPRLAASVQQNLFLTPAEALTLLPADVTDAILLPEADRLSDQFQNIPQATANAVPHAVAAALNFETALAMYQSTTRVFAWLPAASRTAIAETLIIGAIRSITDSDADIDRLIIIMTGYNDAAKAIALIARAANADAGPYAVIPAVAGRPASSGTADQVQADSTIVQTQAALIDTINTEIRQKKVLITAHRLSAVNALTAVRAQHAIATALPAPTAVVANTAVNTAVAQLVTIIPLITVVDDMISAPLTGVQPRKNEARNAVVLAETTGFTMMHHVTRMRLQRGNEIQGLGHILTAERGAAAADALAQAEHARLNALPTPPPPPAPNVAASQAAVAAAGAHVTASAGLNALFLRELNLITTAEAQFTGGAFRVGYNTAIAPAAGGINAAMRADNIIAARVLFDPSYNTARQEFLKIENRVVVPPTGYQYLARNSWIGAEREAQTVIENYAQIQIGRVAALHAETAKAKAGIDADIALLVQANADAIAARDAADRTHTALAAAGGNSAAIQRALFAKNSTVTDAATARRELAAARVDETTADTALRAATVIHDAVKDLLSVGPPAGALRALLTGLNPGDLVARMVAGQSIEAALRALDAQVPAIKVQRDIIVPLAPRVTARVIPAQTAAGNAQASAGLAGIALPGVARVRNDPADDGIITAMAGTLDVTQAENSEFNNQLRNELEQLRDSLENPSAAKMAALPINVLGIAAKLAIDEGGSLPTGPSDLTLLQSLPNANPFMAAIIPALNAVPVARIPPGGDTRWAQIVTAIIDAAKSKKPNELKRLTGGLVPPQVITVKPQGSHPAATSSIIAPMRVPLLTAPVPASVEAILVEALARKQSTIDRLDLEIFNLMIAGFLEQHPAILTPDEADYAIKVAMSTKERLAYCLENRTVGKILFKKLHPEGYTLRHPIEATMARYRDAAIGDRVEVAVAAASPLALEKPAPVGMERYASYGLADTPLALPDNFAAIIRGVETDSSDTKSLIDAYEIYQSAKNASSYNDLIALYHRLMGATLSAVG